MKRVIHRLRWDSKQGRWVLEVRGIYVVQYPHGITKAAVERNARIWTKAAAPSQLLIYTKAGRVGKGGRSEASYGCDSKRRKG